MNKKTLIVIILAILLAFVVALLSNNKQEDSTSITEEIKQEEILLEENTTNTVEKISNETLQQTSKDNTKPINIKPVQTLTEPLVEKVTIQEATIIQEAEPDYGIKKLDNGDIEITREFKYKSPTTYSFKDFGFLYRIK